MGILLIDSSAGVQPLVLEVAPERFGIDLRVRWQGRNGLWRAPDAPGLHANVAPGTGL